MGIAHALTFLSKVHYQMDPNSIFGEGWAPEACKWEVVCLYVASGLKDKPS